MPPTEDLESLIAHLRAISRPVPGRVTVMVRRAELRALLRALEDSRLTGSP